MTGNPLTRQRAIDLYFMEHRAKVIDIAAFLDRVERAASERGGDAGHADVETTGVDDFRLRAFRDALAILTDGRPNRAQRILELLSDPTADPIDKAGVKGATGAWPQRP